MHIVTRPNQTRCIITQLLLTEAFAQPAILIPVANDDRRRG
jgi:hypothetical protein